MFRKALIAFSLMLVSGVLFYDSAYTHPGRTEKSYPPTWLNLDR